MSQVLWYLFRPEMLVEGWGKCDFRCCLVYPAPCLCLVLAGETPQRLLRESVKDASEKAKEAAKSLATAASVPQKPQQYVWPEGRRGDMKPIRCLLDHTNLTGAHWVIDDSLDMNCFLFSLHLYLKHVAFMETLCCDQQHDVTCLPLVCVRLFKYVYFHAGWQNIIFTYIYQLSSIICLHCVCPAWSWRLTKSWYCDCVALIFLTLERTRISTQGLKCTEGMNLRIIEVVTAFTSSSEVLVSLARLQSHLFLKEKVRLSKPPHISVL